MVLWGVAIGGTLGLMVAYKTDSIVYQLVVQFAFFGLSIIMDKLNEVIELLEKENGKKTK